MAAETIKAERTNLFMNTRASKSDSTSNTDKATGPDEARWGRYDQALFRASGTVAMLSTRFRPRIRGNVGSTGIRRGVMQNFALYPDARACAHMFTMGCDGSHINMFIAYCPFQVGCELRSRRAARQARLGCAMSGCAMCGGVGLVRMKNPSELPMPLNAMLALKRHLLRIC